MNLMGLYTKDYQNFIPLAGLKNKPNSNPIKPNFRQEMPKMPYLPACLKRHYAGTVKEAIFVTTNQNASKWLAMVGTFNYCFEKVKAPVKPG
jgi:hypothetical protein